MPHNKSEINADELYELVESIQKYCDKNIKLYALGGTALTILGLKKSTLDVDINIATQAEYNYIIKLFEQIGFKKIGPIRWLTQEGLAFDLFHGEYILGTQLLDDALSRAKLAKEFEKMTIYTLDTYDIIISKLARSDQRDFDDIQVILNTANIDLKLLANRYYLTMNQSMVGQAKQKFIDLISIKCKDWQIPVSKQLKEEVAQWDLR